MLIRQFSLDNDLTVTAPVITGEQEIAEALTHVGISYPRPVIVLIGGAKGINWLERFPVRRAIRIVARLAEETGSAVIDGGTKSGIMLEMGKQRTQNKYSFPLIGVMFDNLLQRRDPKVTMEPNHTHFMLVPGERWGDESAWISRIATQVSGDKKSITVLVNGGKVAKNDVDFSTMANRPIFAMRGTGRMADEIRAGDKIILLPIWQRAAKILELLRAKLS
jgi:hypothetical protein